MKTKESKQDHGWVMTLKTRKVLIESGHFLRCSALAHYAMGTKKIKVIFEGMNRELRAFWMDEKTYHSIPLLENASPAEYMRYGNIVEALNTDIYDTEVA